jgi:hypothetical protein
MPRQPARTATIAGAKNVLLVTTNASPRRARNVAATSRNGYTTYIRTRSKALVRLELREARRYACSVNAVTGTTVVAADPKLSTRNAK